MGWRSPVGVVSGLLVSLALLACPGEGGQGHAHAEGDTADVPAQQVGTAATAAAACPEISRSLVDTGQALYAGTGCSACHGDDATGTAIGPDLADSAWVDIDGSYAAIARLVREGVSQPKAFAVAMPALGVAQLDSLQLCAVAAYVYSLGR
jgi:mono/diheme cytochrome c family protein